MGCIFSRSNQEGQIQAIQSPRSQEATHKYSRGNLSGTSCSRRTC